MPGTMSELTQTLQARITDQVASPDGEPLEFITARFEDIKKELFCTPLRFDMEVDRDSSNRYLDGEVFIDLYADNKAYKPGIIHDVLVAACEAISHPWKPGHSISRIETANIIGLEPLDRYHTGTARLRVLM